MEALWFMFIKNKIYSPEPHDIRDQKIWDVVKFLILIHFQNLIIMLIIHQYIVN